MLTIFYDAPPGSDYFTALASVNPGAASRRLEQTAEYLSRDHGIGCCGYILGEHTPNDTEVLLIFKRNNTSNIALADGLFSLGRDRALPLLTACFSRSLSRASGWAGRHWVAPAGNFHVSLLLKPRIPVDTRSLFTLRLLVYTALISRLQTALPPGAAVRFRLPAEFLVAGKKIGGVLEKGYMGTTVKGLLFGIGLNLNQLPHVADLRDNPYVAGVSSVAHITGASCDVGAWLLDVLRLLLVSLRQFAGARQDTAARALADFQALVYGMGQEVILYADEGNRLTKPLAHGRLCAIDAQGRPVLQTARGRYTHTSRRTFRMLPA